MKKAKIFLTAITVLTVVGGALAFKAQNAFAGKLKCSTVQNACPVTTTVFFRKTVVGGSTEFCTNATNSTSACTQLDRVTTDQ